MDIDAGRSLRGRGLLGTRVTEANGMTPCSYGGAIHKASRFLPAFFHPSLTCIHDPFKFQRECVVSKEKSIKSTGYEVRRYFTPSSITASQTPKLRKVRAQDPHVLPLTYQSLLDSQDRSVRLLELKPQTAANRATALRTFLRANSLTIDDVVGNEMRLAYTAAIERMIAALTNEGQSARNISNTRSAFSHFRDAVIDFDTNRAIHNEQATPFQSALKSVMADTPVKRVAKLSAIPPDMLRGWLLGKQPRPSSVRYLVRLENFFGLEKNSLVTLSGTKPRNFKARLSEVQSAIEYNKTVAALSRQTYCCKPEVGSPLRQQWADFLRYKTAAVPRLLRTKRGKWRISPCPVTAPTKSNWWAFCDDKEVATARVAWHKTSSYLGWLQLTIEDGGKGLAPEQTETLAWLAVPDYIEEFLDWGKERVGKRNQGTTQFLAYIASVVRPRHGYLWQQPKMLATLPIEYQSEDWKTLCERQFTLTEQLVSAFHGEIEVSRDSFEPIRTIIALPQPMEAAIDMVQRMRAARPIGTPKLEALWARDLALIKILLSNPLRKRNLSHLTWKPDNTGELYQQADNSWWIRIPKIKFKNRNGAAGDSIYDVKVQESAWRDIERYIFFFRPKLLKYPTDLVFLKKILHTTTEHRPCDDISSIAYKATAKYLPQSGGFRAHAFRHIVATSILKSEGGTHKIAAKVLNDRIATVEKHYDGLTSNDASEEMGRLLGPYFNRM